jgi:hypothetical protein
MGYDYEEMICPVCKAVIHRAIVILDGDFPSSCDDVAMIMSAVPVCNFLQNSGGCLSHSPQAPVARLG